MTDEKKQKKIDKLTPEQEKYLPVFRDKWLKYAMDTSRIDFEKACQFVDNLYIANDMPKPRFHFFAKSPSEALVIRFALMLMIDKQKEIQNALSMGEKEFESIEFLKGITDKVCDEYHKHEVIEMSINDKREFIINAVNRLLGQDIVENVSSISLYEELYFVGSWDNYWLAWYKFAEYIGVDFGEKLSNQLQAYCDYAQSCGPAYFYPEVAIICDRPTQLHIDGENRLSNENGPAIEFDDGFDCYSVRGTRVPREWFKVGLPSPTEILRIENMEQRIIASEMVGWDKILEELHTETIDKDDDPVIGELIKVLDMPDADGPEYYLKAKCGTGRTVCLNVTLAVTEQGCKTALEAGAATYRIPSDIYKMTAENRT